MKTLHSQQGISYWGVMAMLIVAAFAVQATVTIGPVYLDDMTINKMIEERLRAAAIEEAVDGIRRDLDQQLNLNNLREVKIADIAKIDNTGSGIVVEKDYEVRKPFMGNLDVVMHFKKTFDQKALKSGG